MIAVFDFDPARRTNAQAVSDLARLGWLAPDDFTLDVTLGPDRGFWKLWKPTRLVTNDLDKRVKARHHWDARKLPCEDDSFDVVVLDLPYANRGTTSQEREIDARFGTTTYASPAQREALLVDGTIEAMRVSNSRVLVKCQDAVVAGKFRPQSYPIYEAVMKEGGRLLGLMYVVGNRSQPTGKRQLNVWSNCSTLMLIGV
jgi:hypothetical protein